MRNIEWLLNSVRERTGSDYETAKELEIDRQRISGWRARRSLPTPRQVIAMHERWGIDLKEALLAVEYSREFERPMRETGFGNVSLISAIGIGGLSALFMTQHPAISSLVLSGGGIHCILC